MKYVIIGSGIAAFEGATTIRKLNQDADITIFSNENVLPYRRPALSKLICSNIVENLFYIKPESFYKEQKIELCLNHELYKIDRAKKELTFTNGIVCNYDKLLLAMGGHGFVPRLEGVDLDGVHTLRDYNDLLSLRERIALETKIVIVGGGILGLELAESLQAANFNISIVEGMDRLLARLLSPEESVAFENRIRNEYNIPLYLGSFPKAIKGNSKVESIVLENQISLECDIVVFSAGVRANMLVAADAGLNISKFGIVVNSKLETNDPNIYAAGDCASLDSSPTPGLYLPARDMGANAAKSMCGIDVHYESKVYPNKIRVLGLK